LDTDIGELEGIGRQSANILTKNGYNISKLAAIDDLSYQNPEFIRIMNLIKSERRARNAIFDAKKYVENDKIITETAEELKTIGIEAKKQFGWLYRADAMADTTLKLQIQNYANTKWIDTIARDNTLFSAVPEEGWFQLKDLLPYKQEQLRTLGPLNFGYVNPVLKEELTSHLATHGESGIVGKIVDELVTLRKGTLVATSLKAIIRNYLSGSSIQMDMAGAPLWHPGNALLYKKTSGDFFRYWAKKSAPISEYWAKRGLYGATFADVEIVIPPKLFKQMQNLKSVKDVNSLLDNIISKSAKAYKLTKQTAFGWYGNIDNLNKTYLAQWALDKGYTPEQSVFFAHKWQLDYRFVQQGIEALRGGLVGAAFPFISYQTLILPRVIETLMTRPWILAKYPIAISAFNTYQKATLGISDKEEQQYRPEHLKGDSYAFITGRDGDDIYYSTLAYLLPIGDWKTAFIDTNMIENTFKTGGFYGNLLGLINNKNFFTGREIWGKNNLPSTRWEKQWKYIKQMFASAITQDVSKFIETVNKEEIGIPVPTKVSISREVGRIAGFPVYYGGINSMYWKIKNYQAKIRGYIADFQDIAEEVKTQELKEKDPLKIVELNKRLNSKENELRTEINAAAEELQKNLGMIKNKDILNKLLKYISPAERKAIEKESNEEELKAQ